MMRFINVSFLRGKMNYSEYLNKIYISFKNRDGKTLRNLNDAVLRESLLISSKKIYLIAVLSYVLSKILNKPRFLESKCNESMRDIESALEKLVQYKKECTEEEFEAQFGTVEKTIKKLEAGDPHFVIDMLSKGRLKVAANLYAQGISLGRAAEITGIEKQEILSYAGHTLMFDRVKEEKSVNERLKTLKRFVGG